jgi:hypothetical protein
MYSMRCVVSTCMFRFGSVILAIIVLVGVEQASC